jgi:chromosome partitioning protein
MYIIMIYTIGNIKGGVGKSTLACNFAAILSRMGRDVLLIDGDKQGSAADFTQSRAETFGDPGFACVRAQGAEVRTQAKTMAAKYDDIIIDAGGQDNPSLRAGLVVSDILLAPVSPRSFETWALDGLAELIDEAQAVNDRLAAHAVINMGFPRGADNAETCTIIREDYPSLTLLDPVIVNRKAFSDAAGEGRAVIEAIRRDPKAVEEILSVMTALSVYTGDIQEIYNVRTA